jgi:NAD+ dependent glucose-6-phosphate dehydrogenase
VRLSHPRMFVGDLSTGAGRRSRWTLWRRRPVPRWEGAFEGAQAVVHLAGDPKPQATWESVCRQNIKATWNVLDAAARHGVGRVILASSCRWVLGLQPGTGPRWGRPEIGSATPPCPRTAYGLSKAVNELAGRMFVDTGRLKSVVALRIGSFSADMSTIPEERRLWVRPADLRALIRRCVEAEFEGFHVLYGLSREAAGPFDLSHARELLGWEPRED